MNAIGSLVGSIIIGIAEQAQIFWENLRLLNFSPYEILLDIFLVSIIFYFILTLIRGSRAVQVLIGLSIVGLVFIISKVFQLVALSWLLDRFVTVILVAIPIIFQRELRLGLEKLGKTKFFLYQKERQIERMIRSIVDAALQLSEDKTGALIVIQQSVPLKEFIDTGIETDSKISSEILISIFNKKSPLHDGAAIIVDEKIKAATCILPHSFENTSSGMGTRHKAALGLAETTDAAIIVVSEEKGTISFAREGKMEKNISAQKLQQHLTNMLKKPKTKKKKK
ncbi:TIGR00159 family protein [Candidatus Peregrinibacteria bacterium]|nr:TIGR00159 family protein [Candidatus Peregrinibacteria bacterium]